MLGARALVFLLVAALSVGVNVDARASDHRDAPALSENEKADITDFFMFVHGETDLITIATLHPRADADSAFPKKGLRFLYDIDGDFVQDIQINFKFGGQKNDGTQRLVARYKKHPDPTMRGKLATGRTTAFGCAPSIIQGRHGASLFGGYVDDPFFANAEFLFQPATCPPSNDSFAGFNVLSIALSVPVAELFGGELPLPSVVGAWAETKQDRAGQPLLNTMLIPPAKLNPVGDGSRKNEFNRTPPAQQTAAFGEDILATLRQFNTEAEAQEILDDLAPDVLRMGRMQRTTWPNGRRPGDDVTDDILTVITNAVERRDCVPKNDTNFRETFPFLSPPWAIVNASVVNIRQEPSASSTAIGTTQGGSRLQLLDKSRDGEWYQVQTTAGLTGWVSAEFLLIRQG